MTLNKASKCSPMLFPLSKREYKRFKAIAYLTCTLVVKKIAALLLLLQQQPQQQEETSKQGIRVLKRKQSASFRSGKNHQSKRGLFSTLSFKVSLYACATFGQGQLQHDDHYYFYSRYIPPSHQFKMELIRSQLNEKKGSHN